LTILYTAIATGSQESSLTGFPFLSIGNISLPAGDEWRLCVSGSVCSESMSRRIGGLFSLVAGPGSYSIVAEGSKRGFLGPSEGEISFEVSASTFFFPHGYFTFIAATESRPATSRFTQWEDQIRWHRSVLVSMGSFLFFMGLFSRIQ
jgi:hypothetical protein